MKIIFNSWIEIGPIQDPDWRVRLKNFDSIFAPGTSSTPTPAVNAEQIDLGQNQQQPGVPQQVVADEVSTTSPAAMSAEEFKTKHPTPTATVAMTVGGATLTCAVVEAQCFVMSASKVMLPGVTADGTRPLLHYAGGSWISDSAKERVVFKVFFPQSTLCFLNQVTSHFVQC